MFDLRSATEKDLDAINERARVWKAKQAHGQPPASASSPEQLELPITEEPSQEFPE